jgi:hypothetical protein
MRAQVGTTTDTAGGAGAGAGAADDAGAAVVIGILLSTAALRRFALQHVLLVHALLQQPQARVQAIPSQQVWMGAALDDAAAVHHQNFVSPDNGGKPMRND